MVGVLELKEGRGRRPELDWRYIRDLRCLGAEIPVRAGLRERAIRSRVDKGAAALIRAGVRRVLTAADFPWWEQLRYSGLRPVEPERFCQALAAPLTLAALERQQVPLVQASVVLSGPRVSRALAQAAELLCPRVRWLSVDVPGEGDELAAWLWKEFGAAVVAPGAGRRTHVALHFGPGGETAVTNFELYGSRPSLAGFRPVPPAGMEQEGLDALAVQALLWEEGRLETKEIKISST